MNATEFAGKAVIVTGAAQGIGRTIAEQFLWQGARVLIFDLDAGLALETARQLSPGGEMVVSLGGDVSKREDVHRAVETCVERFGQLDVMVAHAGIADATPLLEIDDATWQHKVAVIERALDLNRPDPTEPLEVLAKVGGLEIAGLVGIALGGRRAGLRWSWMGTSPRRRRWAAIRWCWSR